MSIEDSEDLLQEIFIKVYNSLKSFRKESSVNTWIYRISTNSIIDKLKNKKYEFQKAQCGFDDNPQHYNNSHFSPTIGKQIDSVKIRLHRAKGTLKAALKKNCNVYYDSDGDISCEPK